MRLIIGDDSEILRVRMHEALSEIEGVVVVGEGGEATEIIEVVERLKPDLITLDIQMPEGNGIEALEIIKKMHNPPIVIIFTNYPYLQYRKRCLDAGADFFFYKSLEFDKLIDTVRDLVSCGRQK
jgi:DNA-binding NarL/FixJ family response regulator